MNYKLVILVIAGFVSFRALPAQDSISADYEFVNSVYKNHVKSNLTFYYLYYNPVYEQFIEPLRDTLSKYISDSDILIIKKQIESPDTFFKWSQDYLVNCKVIQKEKVSELQTKNSSLSAIIIDGKTGKPAKNPFNRDSIPSEERQFYFFSKPIWNMDKSLVIFGVQFDEGNHGRNRTSIYRKENNEWKLLTEIAGLNWIKN